MESPGDVREVVAVEDSDVLRYVTETTFLPVSTSTDNDLDRSILSVNASLAVAKCFDEEFCTS